MTTVRSEDRDEGVRLLTLDLGSFPQAAYAHTKLALTQEAIDPESVSARAAQSRKLAGN